MQNFIAKGLCFTIVKSYSRILSNNKVREKVSDTTCGI